jgi:hypothetical protein
MPLWLLGPLVVIGIALIVWLVRRSGGDAPAAFPTDPAHPQCVAMLKAFRARHDGIRIMRCEIAPGGAAALMVLDGGQTGVAVPMGRHFASRVMAPAAPKTRLNGAILHVDFGDAGFPPLALAYPDAQGAKAAQRLFFKAKD